MVAEASVTVTFAGAHLSYQDACAIAEKADSIPAAGVVHLDLAGTSDTTTAALARLIVLRSRFLRTGRDVRLAGLSGRARAIYDICRMGCLLPQTEATA